MNQSIKCFLPNILDECKKETLVRLVFIMIASRGREEEEVKR